MAKNVLLESVRQVYNDGNHNAFTDLCSFKGQYYLTFRSCPDGHMLFTTSRIMILNSEDGKDWNVVHSFNVPDRDTRDPHFLIFKGRIFVYTGTWLVDPRDSLKTDMNEHQGYCAWSDDGAEWHSPKMLDGTHGYYIWRAAEYGGKAYLNGRRIRDFMTVADRKKERHLWESWLMQSSDGLTWNPVGLFQTQYGDETAFLFEDDGSVLAVARTGTERAAQLCRAKPPYKEWTRKDLNRHVGGPMLAKWGKQYLVGGRKKIGKTKPTTSLYWLVEDGLEEVLELPSGGDNSYPGFVELTPDKGLLSYYSSHEGSGTSLAPSAIYLAELSLV